MKPENLKFFLIRWWLSGKICFDFEFQLCIIFSIHFPCHSSRRQGVCLVMDLDLIINHDDDDDHHHHEEDLA